MHSPNLGRWMTVDPIGFAGKNTNLYGYVNNNPVNLVDPFGLVPPGDITREDIQGIVKRDQERCARIDSIKNNQPPFAGAVAWKDNWLCPCPKTLEEMKKLKDTPPYKGNITTWKDPQWVTDKFHAGASETWRINVNGQQANNQCGYDKDGKLITGGTGAGTPDLHGFFIYHWLYDVLPWHLTPEQLLPIYHLLRPPTSAPGAPPNIVIPSNSGTPGPGATHPGTYVPNITGSWERDLDRSLPGSALKPGPKN